MTERHIALDEVQLTPQLFAALLEVVPLADVMTMLGG